MPTCGMIAASFSRQPFNVTRLERSLVAESERKEAGVLQRQMGHGKTSFAQP